MGAGARDHRHGAHQRDVADSRDRLRTRISDGDDSRDVHPDGACGARVSEVVMEGRRAGDWDGDRFTSLFLLRLFPRPLWIRKRGLSWWREWNLADVCHLGPNGN